MTAPITPDERAALRETIATLDAAWEADDPTRPLVTEHATLTLLAHVASAVPRLLDALDTAEAEVARLTPPCDGGCSYNDGPAEDCSAHGRPVAEVWGIVAEVQRQRDEAAPVRPDREAARLAQHRALMPQVMSIFAAVGGTQADYDALLDTLADAVLAEWPGESRATVQAEALRDAADTIERYAQRTDVRLTEHAIAESGGPHVLREYADRLEKGADRG